MSDSKEVGQPIIQFVPIILNNDTDNNGFPGLVTSSDNGATRVMEYTADGKVYHDRDAKRIAELPFEHIKMESPNGTAFYLSVSDDGKPIFTPIKEAGDSK